MNATTLHILERTSSDERQFPSFSRQAILDTTRSTLRQVGYESLSMEAVAKSAKTTRRTLYNNFASKSELYRASRLSLIYELIEMRVSAIPPRMSPTDGFRFYAENIYQILGSAANGDLVVSIIRDHSQAWLKDEYIRLVRDPMIMIVENYCLLHLRCRGIRSQFARQISEQLVNAVETLAVRPLMGVCSLTSSTSVDAALSIVASAYGSMLESYTDNAVTL